MAKRDSGFRVTASVFRVPSSSRLSGSGFRVYFVTLGLNSVTAKALGFYRLVFSKGSERCDFSAAAEPASRKPELSNIVRFAEPEPELL